MLDVLKVELKPNKIRLGVLHVKYYDITLLCDLCLYGESHLWVRMPEIWTVNNGKKRFIYWEDKKFSDNFQKTVLNKMFDMVGLTLEQAIKMKKEFFSKKTKKIKKD